MAHSLFITGDPFAPERVLNTAPPPVRHTNNGYTGSIAFDCSGLSPAPPRNDVHINSEQIRPHMTDLHALPPRRIVSAGTTLEGRAIITVVTGANPAPTLPPKPQAPYSNERLLGMTFVQNPLYNRGE